jgi:dihydroorotate dehydrogenase electron transfer subunit
MPTDFSSRVVRNLDIGHGNFLLEFEAPGEVLRMEPSQFFMIGIPGSEVLLRRPFSVCGVPGTFDDGRPGCVQILYRVYGRGTSLLAHMAPGAEIQVLGPLGRGFRPPDSPRVEPWLVAGGIGSAPFPALIGALRRAGSPAPQMFYGARSRADLPLLDWFERHCAGVTVTTDDGSHGRKDLVVAPLREALDAATTAVHLYACGPTPMLRAVRELALERGVSCDLSLEAPMACGFGVCLGCVVPCRGDTPGDVRYERVCVEGPVMPAEKLAW